MILLLWCLIEISRHDLCQVKIMKRSIFISFKPWSSLLCNAKSVAGEGDNMIPDILRLCQRGPPLISARGYQLRASRLRLIELIHSQSNQIGWMSNFTYGYVFSSENRIDTFVICFERRIWRKQDERRGGWGGGGEAPIVPNYCECLRQQLRKWANT